MFAHMRRNLMAGAAVVAVLQTGGVVQAQTMPTDETPAAAAQNQPAGAMSDIVVTANRREENLQKVPQSVSVIGSEALIQQNVTDVKSMMRAMPSLKYQTGSLTVTQVLTLRGVGTLATNPNLQLSVGVAQDGITAARIAAATPDLADIERIEVLKGPQGLLFGKNSSAGLVNVITHKPVLGDIQASARIQVGEIGERQAQLVGNLPVGDTFAVRAALWNFRHDGLITTINQPGAERGNKNNDGARLSTRWSPTGNLDINLSGQWTRQRNDGAGLAIYKFQPGNFTAANMGALVQANETAQGIVPGFRNRVASNTVDTYHKQDDSLYIADVAYHFDNGGTLSSTSSRAHTDLDDRYDPQSWNTTYGATPVGGKMFRNQTRFTQYTQEFRYTSPSSGPVKFVAGLYYDHLDLFDRLTADTYGSVATPVYSQSDTNSTFESKAAFGQATWSVTDRLRLTGGARYTIDRMHTSLNRVPLITPAIVVPALNGPGAAFGPLAATGSARKNAWSGRASVDYDLAPKVMAYLAFAKGYKAPSNQIAQQLTQTAITQSNGGAVGAEYSTLYEAGLKTRIFDNRVQFNISIFDEAFDNFQTSARIVGAPTVIFAIQNAKQAKSTGVEVDMSALLAPGLTLNAAGAYTDARFTNFRNAPCYTGQSAAQGCVGGQQDVSGNRLPNAPAWSGGLSMHYERPLSSAFNGFLDGSATYQSATRYDQTNDPNQRQGGYSIVNLATGFETADDHIRVTVSVRNLFNTYYVDRVVALSNTVGYGVYPNYGSFRTFAAAVELKF